MKKNKMTPQQKVANKPLRYSETVEEIEKDYGTVTKTTIIKGRLKTVILDNLKIRGKDKYIRKEIETDY